MVYVISDIEWNGAYCKKVAGYFNEIIEIGAVMLDENMAEIDSFSMPIRPVVSKKITSLVTGLTNITQESLADGYTFPGALAALRRWIGKRDAVFMSWSTTDLLVWMENCRYFCKDERLPFLRRYADAQQYCQQRLGTGGGQQLGLGAAAERLGIDTAGMELHRALEDSRLTAEVLRRVYEPEAFAACLQPADDAFYRRINFKIYFIRDLQDPVVDPADFRFCCDHCGGVLQPAADWRLRNRGFQAEHSCPQCGGAYIARVQYKMKYEGPEVRRRIWEKPPEPEEPATAAEAT